MKRLLILSVGFIFTFGLAPLQADEFTIGILAYHYTEHEHEVVSSFRDGIELSGIDHQFDLKVADGDAVKCRDILTQWQEQQIDLVFTIGVSATRIAQQEIEDTPIVFAIESDPVTSSIVESLEQPGHNITGVSNWVSAYRKLGIFNSAMPNLKRLGVIYNPQSPVASMEVHDAQATARTRGIALISEQILDSDDAQQALENLWAQEIDALWIPFDKTIFPKLGQIAQFSRNHQLPVLSSTLNGVELTTEQKPFAMVGIGVDHNRLGRRSVHYAIEILIRKSAADKLPVEILEPFIVANVNSANLIDFQLPPLFLANSDQIIRGFAGQKITVGGTGDSQLLLRKLGQALQNKLKGGEIEVPDSIGSTGGIKSLVSGRIDLARTARPLRDSEKIFQLTSLVFAQSPVVFAVNPSVTDIDNLDQQHIVDIYSGRIVNWRDLGGQNKRIFAVTRENGDSSRALLTKHLPEFGDIKNPKAKTIYSTPETVDALVRHRDTIGFTALSAIKGTRLRVLKLNGIYPSAENILNGKYPLVTPLSIVYRLTPNELSQAFIDFIYSDEGQQIISQFGAIPVKR